MISDTKFQVKKAQNDQSPRNIFLRLIYTERNKALWKILVKCAKTLSEL